MATSHKKYTLHGSNLTFISTFFCNHIIPEGLRIKTSTLVLMYLFYISHCKKDGMKLMSWLLKLLKGYLCDVIHMLTKRIEDLEPWLRRNMSFAGELQMIKTKTQNVATSFEKRNINQLSQFGNNKLRRRKHCFQKKKN